MIRIEPFEPRFAAGVVDLILLIQRAEFEIPISLDDQPDLRDVAAFYRNGNGNFWVALAQSEVVGTVGLLDIGNDQGALRKMFVKAEYRGAAHAVARNLLETLLAWCDQRGIREVFLGTTARFLAAHRFYEKSGFCAIDRAALPQAFPVITVDTKFYCRAMGVQPA